VPESAPGTRRLVLLSTTHRVAAGLLSHAGWAALGSAAEVYAGAADHPLALALDAAGNVLVALCAPCRSGQTGKATIAHSVEDALERGRTYVNVHTPKNLAGEIRGQVKETGGS
jgi:hypothetical protein